MNTFCLVDQTIPERLRTIADPPHELHIASDNWEDILMRPAVAIVGSRRPSRYGETITHQLAFELAAAGVVIVSGLAYGVDSIAHRGALDAGGITVAVLPSSLDYVYPRAHQGLAQKILGQGGALVTEQPTGEPGVHKHQFVQRNRLISGFASITLITEATLKSGSRHTVDYAADQGRACMVIPGELTNPLAAGPLRLFHEEGATLITGSADILSHLKIQSAGAARRSLNANPDQQSIITLLEAGISSGRDLLERSGLPPGVYHQAITMLELSGQIRPLGNDYWAPG